MQSAQLLQIFIGQTLFDLSRFSSPLSSCIMLLTNVFPYQIPQSHAMTIRKCIGLAQIKSKKSSRLIEKRLEGGDAIRALIHVDQIMLRLRHPESE